MGKNRVEAFSDGVFAVAITLLALNLPIPHVATPHLAAFLGHHWPNFGAFVVSFLTIGIIWINHHAMFKRLRVVDHAMMLLNLLLLMSVCLMPFTTALVAKYLPAAQGEGLAAGIWAGSFLVMSVIFMLCQGHVMRPGSSLVHASLTPQSRWAVMTRNSVGLLPYVVAVVAAPISPYITLAICGLVALFYALPTTTAVGLDGIDG